MSNNCRECASKIEIFFQFLHDLNQLEDSLVHCSDIPLAFSLVFSLFVSFSVLKKRQSLVNLFGFILSFSSEGRKREEKFLTFL